MIDFNSITQIACIASPLEAEFFSTVTSHPISKIKNYFQAQNEFVVVENFLPESILDSFITALPLLQSSINRNYIPGHKKGGSVSK